MLLGHGELNHGHPLPVFALQIIFTFGGHCMLL